MKKCIVISLMLISYLQINAQPEISYIIPDVAAPGMPVYIEIIGPFDSDSVTRLSKNFEEDGLYLNTNEDAFRVRCSNPEDEWKLTFSPFVVSWDGHMISTIVFPSDRLTPNSSDWELLENEYRIGIHIFNAWGQISNTDTIYIVKPWTLGDLTQIPETVLGEGSLGKRSRRGAMIVDSLILANSTYSVSTKDCDPYTPGNQGYLPFILLSASKIIGSENTIIDVSGQSSMDGHGGNGGPGGGGGGGKICDVLFGNGGDNGGSGYVTGGRGGWNTATGGGGYKSYGESSADSGRSLNGVDPPSSSSTNWESSGGGTGHPFGKSGRGVGDGQVGNPPGGYGGGSGFTQRRNGGSGGYATKGANSLGRNANNELSQSGGLIHGNAMGVPLAGGSGGASGNPNSLNECSGSGGGGGGAISLFAPFIDNIAIKSNGADGTNGTDGTNTRGGSGSGGFIGLGSKLESNNFSLQVEGGKDEDSETIGGAGRMRIDNLNPELLNEQESVDASKYRGITTDTSRYISRKHKLTGSCDMTKTLNSFIKPESGDWQEFRRPDAVFEDGSWEMYLDFTDERYLNDTLFYFILCQEERNPVKDLDKHVYEPSIVLSTAAANIFRITDSVTTVQKNDLEQFEFSISPNPFKDKVAINFDIPQSGQVRIILSDLVGNELNVITDKIYTSGKHNINIYNSKLNLSIGTYLVTIYFNGESITKKLVLMK